MDNARLENIETQIARQKKHTAETKGTITNYQEHQYIKHKSHAVTYDYTVNGKVYSQTTESAVGSYESYCKSVYGKVCYDPANPENAFFSLKDENTTCGA